MSLSSKKGQGYYSIPSYFTVSMVLLTEIVCFYIRYYGDFHLPMSSTFASFIDRIFPQIVRAHQEVILVIVRQAFLLFLVRGNLQLGALFLMLFFVWCFFLFLNHEH